MSWVEGGYGDGLHRMYWRLVVTRWHGNVVVLLTKRHVKNNYTFV